MDRLVDGERRGIDNFVSMGKDLPQSIGLKLTAAATENRKFVIGVTGGSSTASKDETGQSWVDRLELWLKQAVNITNLEIRNAAQGTTSQLVTSVCLEPLVGTNLDLLLWEFAMNDEYEYIKKDKKPNYPIRERVADAYIREAIAASPAIGFVHLWDLDIHSYKGSSAIPNKAYAPTNRVMTYYSDIYRSYFALDTMGALHGLRLFRTKNDFLRDEHHPNSFGNEIAADFVVYNLVVSWMKSFEESHERFQRYNRAAVFSKPTYTEIVNKDFRNVVLPKENSTGRCYMAMPPQFGTSRAFLPITIVKEHDVGKADEMRHDRQNRFDVSKNTNGLQLQIRVTLAEYLLLDCGFLQSSLCIKNLRVTLDGADIAPNVVLRNDIMNGFYGWIHQFKEPLAASYHNLSISSASNHTYISRVVVLLPLAE